MNDQAFLIYIEFADGRTYEKWAWDIDQMREIRDYYRYDLGLEVEIVSG